MGLWGNRGGKISRFQFHEPTNYDDYAKGYMCRHTHISEANRDRGKADKAALLSMGAARVDKVTGEHGDEV